jgi:hypothetical protein
VLVGGWWSVAGYYLQTDGEYAAQQPTTGHQPLTTDY